LPNDRITSTSTNLPKTSVATFHKGAAIVGMAQKTASFSVGSHSGSSKCFTWATQHRVAPIIAPTICPARWTSTSAKESPESPARSGPRVTAGLMCAPRPVGLGEHHVGDHPGPQEDEDRFSHDFGEEDLCEHARPFETKQLDGSK